MTVPLRWRLVLITTTLMAVVLATIGAVILVKFRADLMATVDTSIQLRAEGLADVNERLPGSELRGVEPDESFAQVLSASGEVLDESPGLTSDASLTASQRGTVSEQRQIFSNEVATVEEVVPARLLAWRTSDDNIVVIGASIEDQDEAVQSLLVLMLIGGVVAVVLSGAAAWLVAGFALRPIDRLRREAAQISGTHQQRLAVPATRDELERLARTLNQMLDRLDEASEAQSRFIADASHELRTPLTNLTLEVDLALKESSDAKALAAALVSIRSEIDALVQLAESLLDLAQTSDGGVQLTLQPVDLAALLRSETARFEPRAQSSDVRLALDIPDAISVQCDELRVRQVVANLLDNAIRHSPDGATVTLSAQVAPTQVTVEVSDEGEGLPSNTAEVFAPFWRFDDGRARDAGGVGLGLAISRAIVEAHGGTIAAENGSASGSVFRFTLPR